MTPEDKLQAVMSWIDDSLKPIEHSVELSRYRMLKLFEFTQAVQAQKKTTILSNSNNDFLIFCDYDEVSILDRKRGKYGKARRRKMDNFNLFFGLAIAWTRLNGRKLPEFACGFEPQQITVYQIGQKRSYEEKFYHCFQQIFSSHAAHIRNAFLHLNTQMMQISSCLNSKLMISIITLCTNLENLLLTCLYLIFRSSILILQSQGTLHCSGDCFLCLQLSRGHIFRSKQ